MKTVAVINGPNLNTLGKRETLIYGHQNLNDINHDLNILAKKLNLQLEFMQSNIEGELINHIQSVSKHCDCIIINAGAYTHTSIAIRDALIAAALPFIEVHLSNVDRREEFRKISYLSDIASGVISGFGPFSYKLALYGAEKILNHDHKAA